MEVKLAIMHYEGLATYTPMSRIELINTLRVITVFGKRFVATEGLSSSPKLQ